MILSCASNFTKPDVLRTSGFRGVMHSKPFGKDCCRVQIDFITSGKASDLCPRFSGINQNKQTFCIAHLLCRQHALIALRFTDGRNNTGESTNSSVGNTGPRFFRYQDYRKHSSSKHHKATMAKSTNSEHRAQLIREMSKDVNRTRHSSASSRNSQGHTSPEPTISEFDPENEAIMSTRQLDNHSQQLPDLRTSARKYSRFARPTEPDFAINTSAIGRAFPDFSQGGSSSEDESMSIEIGRGVDKGGNSNRKQHAGAREYSSHAQISLDGESMDFSTPVIGNYEITGTPPLRQGPKPKQRDQEIRDLNKKANQTRRPSGLQNEIRDLASPPAKTKDYGSGESRKGSGQTRRTLASMHARVQDEHDHRPPTVDLTVRNTRFGKANHALADTQPGLPTRFSSAQTLLGSIAPSKKQSIQNAGVVSHGTQQSFMLPDLPNISELVSGVFEDGTPVFSRHSRSRSSRFPATSQPNANKSQAYASVNEIAVPDDEQAIFLSLKLLQDKVALLEKTNADAATTIDELQQKNKSLEEDISHRRPAPRNDSALGTTDSEGDHKSGSTQRKLLIEKNRKESSLTYSIYH